MMNTPYTITPLDEDANVRLDKYMASQMADVSRARLQQLIKDGHLTINGQEVTDPSARVKPGYEISLTIPPAAPAAPRAQEIDLDVIFEDDDLLVLNKPPGMVVHPAAGNVDGTLVNALLAHCGDSLSGIGGVKRPGIVHRLDKDTSGLMIVAKNDKTHQGLSAQFADRSLSRTYLALVWGLPSPTSGRVEAAIGRAPNERTKMSVVEQGGKEAATNYKTTGTVGMPPALSLVECKLETGRTHQIRVHMSYIGHPLVGDPLYGISPTQRKRANIPANIFEIIRKFPRQALHAAKIEFIHPASQETMNFECELPMDFRKLMDSLESI